MASIFQKQTVTLCVSWGIEGGVWHSFDSDIWNLSGRYCLTEDMFSADVLIIIAYGNDNTNLNNYLEQNGFKGILCFWLIDNHLSHEKNRASVLEGDFYFCSHHGQIHEDYLLNERSIAAPVLPACYMGLSLEIVTSMMQRFNNLPRLSKVVAPYFTYNFPGLPRTIFLDKLQTDFPDFICLYTRAEERQKGYHNALSDIEKCARWLYFKSSVVVPLNQDLSIRVFDGLIWGHTVLVPDNLPAFDYVFSEEEQKKLGIVRYDMDGGNDAIRAAAREALRLFAEMGTDGVTYRHNFVITSHMRAHRVRSVLSFLEDFATGKVTNKLLLGEGVSGLKSFQIT
jgi:hypothetical protein